MPVDNIAQVMQVLRRQMAQNLERMRGSNVRAGAAAPSPAPTSPTPRAAPPLRQAVARRVKAIDPDDPRHLEKVSLLFVESVLLAEFPEAGVNDPGFRDLIIQVQSAMLADAELGRDLGRLATRLRDAKD